MFRGVTSAGVLLTDSSQDGLVASIQHAALLGIDLIITDDNLSDASVDVLRDRGVDAERV